MQGPWCHKPDDGGARATVTEPAGEKNKVKTTSRPFADYVRFETKEGLALLYDPTPLDKWIGKDYIWDSKNKLQMDPKTGEVLTDLQQRRVKTFDASCNGTKRGGRQGHKPTSSSSWWPNAAREWKRSSEFIESI